MQLLLYEIRESILNAAAMVNAGIEQLVISYSSAQLRQIPERLM